MDKNMAVETGAAVGAGMAAKYGVAAKLTVMFGSSAIGAAIIAAYHPPTRRDTWWQALGAGVGGLIFGPILMKSLAQFVPWLAPSPDLFDWLSTVAPCLFVFGGLFWGAIGALRGLQSRIARKGGAALGKRVGL
jgi:hypothetical protein